MKVNTLDNEVIDYEITVIDKRCNSGWNRIHLKNSSLVDLEKYIKKKKDKIIAIYPADGSIFGYSIDEFYRTYLNTAKNCFSCMYCRKNFYGFTPKNKYERFCSRKKETINPKTNHRCKEYKMDANIEKKHKS